MKRARAGRKLLIASLGVAAVAYGCQKNGEGPETVGNLVAPEPTQAEPDAALADPPPPEQPPEPVGNLMPPPPEPPDGG